MFVPLPVPGDSLPGREGGGDGREPPHTHTHTHSAVTVVLAISMSQAFRVTIKVFCCVNVIVLFKCYALFNPSVHKKQDLCQFIVTQSRTSRADKYID